MKKIFKFSHNVNIMELRRNTQCQHIYIMTNNYNDFVQYIYRWERVSDTPTDWNCNQNIYTHWTAFVCSSISIFDPKIYCFDCIRNEGHIAFNYIHNWCWQSFELNHLCWICKLQILQLWDSILLIIYGDDEKFRWSLHFNLYQIL